MKRDLVWKPTHPDGYAAPPAYEGDVGVDLTTVEDIEVHPGEIKYAPLGVAFAPPEDCWLMLAGRSSTARKLGLATIPGIIDPGYRGEMFAGVYIAGGWPDGDYHPLNAVHVSKGTTLAQAILIPAIQPVLYRSVGPLPESHRGENGFGSSGENRLEPKRPMWCGVHQAKQLVPRQICEAYDTDRADCDLQEVFT